MAHSPVLEGRFIVLAPDEFPTDRGKIVDRANELLDAIREKLTDEFPAAVFLTDIDFTEGGGDDEEAA